MTPIHAALRRVFPDPRVEVGSALVCEPAPRIFPEEEAALVDAVPYRRLEYAHTRNCARGALARLGVAEGAIPTQSDRTPRWPHGFVGSVAHCDGLCAVVVARSEEVLALGLDIEQRERMKPETWDEVCSPRELSLLKDRGGSIGDDVALVFSAKEAVFKAQYPISRDDDLELTDVAVEFDHSASTFVATFLRDAGRRFTAGTQIGGRFVISGEIIVTGVTLWI